ARGGPGDGDRAGDRRCSARRDRNQPARPGHQPRGEQRAAAERPPIFVACAADLGRKGVADRHRQQRDGADARRLVQREWPDSTFSNYMLDGLDNNAYGTSNQGFSNQVIQPPPDSVAEFQVVTNNESAEYGRSAGATINVAYASGTNQLHLNLWEFLRNTDLNAVGFFRPRVGSNFPFH